MRLEALFSSPDQVQRLADFPGPLQPNDLISGNDGPWEVELGFGRGRFMLKSALKHPQRRFLGVEIVSKYYRLLEGRARRQGADNLVVVRGEALYLLSSVIPAGFASVLHIYFPDPWPKIRHHKRRLFDPETVDLVLGILKPGGRLCFATDFLKYGELVHDILQDIPGLSLTRRAEPWPDGARTNYEAKYIEEGRPILRLEGQMAAELPAERLHPNGAHGIVAATSVRPIH